MQWVYGMHIGLPGQKYLGTQDQRLNQAYLVPLEARGRHIGTIHRIGIYCRNIRTLEEQCDRAGVSDEAQEYRLTGLYTSRCTRQVREGSDQSKLIMLRTMTQSV